MKQTNTNYCKTRQHSTS